MAAKSLRVRIMAFQPTAPGFSLGEKCTFSTTQSVFKRSNRFFPGRTTTAQSSPGPAMTSGRALACTSSRAISRSSPNSRSFIAEAGWERRAR